ncbi:Er-derived vesicles protein erv14 [Mycena venus]|uniref:Er-derived vesicles protein erv14 n=1 Tax=Mycena venus TaxID=2733690 RepID=A0A8H6XQY5_9AGAR|nr:Er-derived vesicles protein erv14 [Mycena venus]
MGDGYSFLFAMLVAAFLMFCSLFFLILFSDFEDQRISKEQLCKTLNQFVIIELVAPIFLAGLFLGSRQWLPFVLNVPVTVYNFNKIRNNDHLFVPEPDEVPEGSSGTQERDLCEDRVLSVIILGLFVLYVCRPHNIN